MARSNAAAKAVGIEKLADMRKWFKGISHGEYKDFFYKEVVPKYAKKLEMYGKREARRISRTGQLTNNVIVGRGKAGRGYPSVWLGAKGPAAAYAKIIDKGGTQKMDKKYLTIPLDAARTSTGAKKKSVRDYPNRMTFIWDIPASRAGKWGKLAGQKVLFKKERNFPVYGKGSRKKRAGAYGSGPKKDRIYYHKITPLFIYAKENEVKATYWATNAIKKSKADVRKMIQDYNKNFVKRKKR